MSDYIPDELQFKIFEKLPVKSLIRCSSVCKSWYSAIRNPSFITQHLKQVNNSPDRIVEDEKIVFTAVVAAADGREKIGFYSLNADNLCHNHLNLDRSSSSSSALYDARLVGCCSGLVCLLLISKKVSEVDRVVIWNPCIRKSVSILCTQASKGNLTLYGFFVHPTTHQYKVAAFPLRNNVHDAPYNVEIYRQHTGAWSVNNSAIPYFISLSGATVNGVVHWLATDKFYDGQNSILLFNMHAEAFSEMTLPPSVVHQTILSLQLTFSSESLVLYESCFQSDCSTLWVMKDYGISESWTKLFSIESPVEWHALPLGLRRNGQLLLTTTGKSLLCYDPVTSETTTVAVEGILPVVADTYVESLLLLNVNGASEHESFGEFLSYN